MRIIAAGPFHNVVFWSLLIGAGWTGIGRIWSVVGYRDISAFGRVVVGVAEVFSIL
jgi:S2P endopeptidase